MSAIRDLLALTARDDVISLAGGLPATDSIPLQRVRRAAEDALGESSSVQYGETSGRRALRAVVAERESRHLGRTIDPSEVVITHGSQQALTLLAHCSTRDRSSWSMNPLIPVRCRCSRSPTLTSARFRSPTTKWLRTNSPVCSRSGSTPQRPDASSHRLPLRSRHSTVQCLEDSCTDAPSGRVAHVATR